MAVCLILSLTGVASASGDSTIESALDTAEMFSDRDLEPTADLSATVTYTVSDGQDIHITAEGVYVLNGSASDVTVYVEAGDEDKVQLVLDGVTVTNADFPSIYIKSADKVFVTTVSDSSLSVTGSFMADGGTNTDGVIFSRDDLTLNGTAKLTIATSENGVVTKDDLKITGGSYEITAASKCFEANDSIRIADGTFHLNAGTDALHAENDDDDSLGWVYIGGGNFAITSGDDGIHGHSVVQIDGGTIDVSGMSTFDYDGAGQYNGGTILVNGQQVSSLPNQMMGGASGSMGGRGRRG